MKQYRGVTRFRTVVLGHKWQNVKRSCFQLRLQFDGHRDERYVLNSSVREMCEQIDWAIDDLGATVKDGVLVFTPEQCQRFQSPRPEFFKKHEDSLELLLEWFYSLPINTPVEAVK